MRLYRGLAEVPADVSPSALTIGKFDGVHAGHRAVIGQVTSAAAERGLTSTVVTFDRHPMSLLAPESCPQALVGTQQKLDLLAETGVDAVLMVTFDHAFAGLLPEEFVQRVLVDTLKAKLVLVGRDFRFGNRGAGTVELLTRLGEQHGFEVQVLDDVTPAGQRRVSSTWIRELMAAGDVALARTLLGHEPCVRGVVVPGARRGRELGFPTANISPDLEGLIPADGVYAGWLTVDGRRYPAAISVGSNPTFEGVPPKQVEAYVLDEDIDLYGLEVDVCFTERIRPMVAFEGVDRLVEQIADDVEKVRAIVGAARPDPA